MQLKKDNQILVEIEIKKNEFLSAWWSNTINDFSPYLWIFTLKHKNLLSNAVRCRL